MPTLTPINPTHLEAVTGGTKHDINASITDQCSGVGQTLAHIASNEYRTNARLTPAQRAVAHNRFAEMASGVCRSLERDGFNLDPANTF
jgi:hypothetical protein